MTVSSTRRLSIGTALLLASTFGLALPAQAQGLFSAAVTVNDAAVTRYEIAQRTALLQFFGQRDATAALAQAQLVDEALRKARMAADGFAMTQENYEAALSDFAQNNNLDRTQFLNTLKQAGIEEPSFRHYLTNNAGWRDYVRARFASRVNVTDAELDAFMARTATQAAGFEVLLSEFIMPIIPEHIEEIRRIVERVSQMTSTESFSAAATEYSVVPSRENGGRLEWTPITNFPPQIANVLMSMEPGQVTPPLDITNGVALLQLRSKREGRIPAASIASVEYASFTLPTAEAAYDALALSATCDDLYSHLPQGTSVARETMSPSALPQTLALATAKLDPNEWTLASQDADGATFIMLCARTQAESGSLTRDAALNALRTQKLQSYADALTAELRSAATIVVQ